MSENPWSEWLRRARSNLARAKLDRQTEEILYEDLCFDAQQAAEKALKGLILYYGIRPPRTHSIGYLLNITMDGIGLEVPYEVRDSAALTDYAVMTRYPGNFEPVDEAEYRKAVSLADAVYSWVTSIIW